MSETTVIPPALIENNPPVLIENKQFNLEDAIYKEVANFLAFPSFFPFSINDPSNTADNTTEPLKVEDQLFKTIDNSSNDTIFRIASVKNKKYIYKKITLIAL